MSQHSPLPKVGFDNIPFIVRDHGTIDQEAVYPDWTQPSGLQATHIPGSNLTVLQDMGSPAATLTLKLEFPSVSDYRAFRRRIGHEGTLVLLAGYTSAVGVVETHFKVDYEAFGHVTLMGVANAFIAVGQQFAECDATFLRAMDPLTGLAEVS